VRFSLSIGTMVSSPNIDVYHPWKFSKTVFIKLKSAVRTFKPLGSISISLLPVWRQYVLAFGVFALVTFLSFWMQKWCGYQAIALIYLLGVVLLALVVNRGATLFGTLLTAAGWNFFFAPPAFAFNISDTYDNMMLLSYFVVTLTVGQLTTRLRAHRDAELQAKLLAESEKLGRTLLRSVSHELRTPIAAINSAAHTLPSTGPLNKEQENLISEIEAASIRLNRIVQGLLSAARIQTGQVRPNMDWCDIADLVRVTLNGIKDQIFSHRIRIFLPKNLPLVKADFILTEQALANLVVNAVTYTKPGTPIEIVGQIENGFLALAVLDEGPGVPPDQLERIFDPFQRGGVTKTGGVGLGLAIVKGFVEVQGGRVEAANRGVGGAAFTIYLNANDSPSLPQEIL
jgi:K+-sensing histidine kinase KdpD